MPVVTGSGRLPAGTEAPETGAGRAIVCYVRVRVQILTYPVGVVVGLLPVVVELGVPPRPASLLLDGRPACTFVSDTSACVVELGAAPRVHLLELVRKGPSGNVVERAVRWVNRPGAAEAEIQTKTTCAPKSETCTVVVGWAHPGRLNPSSTKVTLDGKGVFLPKNRTLVVPARTDRGALLTVDLVFPDGRRAFHAGAVGGRTRGDEGADLTAVLHERACEEGVADRAVRRYAAAGVSLRAFEPGEWAGEWEVTFVAEPQVEPLLRGLFEWLKKSKVPEGVRNALDGAAVLTGVVADDALREGDLLQKGKAEMWVERLLAAIGRGPQEGLRTADAVAAAAFHTGAAPRRRAVVLLLGGSGLDTSRLPGAGVRRYAAEVGVPLEVWRLDPADRPEWPADRVIATAQGFEDALVQLRRRISCQGVAWVEADYRAAAAAAAEPAEKQP
jgi:hypothetical protein